MRKCAKCPQTAQGFTILEVRLAHDAFVVPYEWRCQTHVREIDPTVVYFRKGHHYGFESPTRRVELALFERAYADCRRRAPAIFEAEEQTENDIRVILGLSKLTEEQADRFMADWQRTATALPQPKIEVINARDLAS